MPETKEWTLMFYMASDNPLAISVVSQLKALKAAGFHHEANVIAQFDPYTEGTPTHIFDINLVNKLAQTDKKPKIGFTDDDDLLAVRTLIEDKLWGEEKGEDGKEIRMELQEVLRAKHRDMFDYKPPAPPNLNGDSQPPSPSPTAPTVAVEMAAQHGAPKGIPERPPRQRRTEPDPYNSLYHFLHFCYEHYPARHYMLFILGHGVVVGNDIFLYDEHAEEQSITLSEMGVLLKDFKGKLPKGSEFDLIGFHSCSVSSLEVAYELQGTANYMLASQAPSFVGSWPYRHILMRIFKDLEPNGASKNIPAILDDIFSYCMHSSKDFLLAGYSYQLTLCDLRRIPEFSESMENLSNALVNGMEDAASTFIILYSHWKAQSFFQEMYTDLHDFCFCINDRFKRIQEAQQEAARLAGEERPDTTSRQLRDVDSACTVVRDKLSSLVVKSEYTGPAYQYSRGLSVYFPWNRPSADSQIMEQYEGYLFTIAFREKGSTDPERKAWYDFLDKYFGATQRVTAGTELFWELPASKREAKLRVEPKPDREQKVNEDIASLIYNGEGPRGGSLSKSDPKDRTGGDCDCPSFKNYPRDTRARKDRRDKAQPMPVPGSLMGDFKPRLS